MAEKYQKPGLEEIHIQNCQCFLASSKDDNIGGTEGFINDPEIGWN